jgi:hypothetical protein
MIAGSKRTRDETFDGDDETLRYHNGAREDPTYQQSDNLLTYRRADGFSVSRKPTDVL